MKKISNLEFKQLEILSARYGNVCSLIKVSRSPQKELFMKVWFSRSCFMDQKVGVWPRNCSIFYVRSTLDLSAPCAELTDGMWENTELQQRSFWWGLDSSLSTPTSHKDSCVGLATSRGWPMIVSPGRCYRRGCPVSVPEVHRSSPMGADYTKHWKRWKWARTTGMRWRKTVSNGEKLWSRWIEWQFVLFLSKRCDSWVYMYAWAHSLC